MLRKKMRISNPSCDRTWRPICERYPEFMQEQWDLDAREEEEAKVEIALKAERQKAEAAKQAQKECRKRQTEARLASGLSPHLEHPPNGSLWPTSATITSLSSLLCLRPRCSCLKTSRWPIPQCQRRRPVLIIVSMMQEVNMNRNTRRG
ncbi:hypothetical protein BKA82DRAFT_4338154 [Pisolithus tinctorius]|nr:hypothetical protein BKA82DRAFT_4338154 [Pisolithus tinctorius]